MNLYAYAHNNPLCYTDPDGQFAIAIPIVQVAIGAALGPLVVPTLSVIAIAAVVYSAYQLMDSLDHRLNQVEIEDLQEATEEEGRNRRKYNSSEDPDKVRVGSPKDRRATNRGIQNSDKISCRRCRPDAMATEAHSVFRRAPLTNKTSHYETYRPQTNPRNPNP